MNHRLFLFLCALGSITVLFGNSAAATNSRERISLNQIAIVTDSPEPSYIQYGTQDLASYLTAITGTATRVTTTLDPQAESPIVVGKMGERLLPGVLLEKELSEQGFVIKSVMLDGKRRLIVAGANPQGTNFGIATLMKMIRAEGKSAYLDALLMWDKQTGWERLINIGIWRSPLYASDKRFEEALSILKRVLGGGASVTNYAAVSSFFDPIGKRLLQKYGQDAVMVGCIEPLKLAVIQAP